MEISALTEKKNTLLNCKKNLINSQKALIKKEDTVKLNQLEKTT